MNPNLVSKDGEVAAQSCKVHIDIDAVYLYSTMKGALISIGVYRAKLGFYLPESCTGCGAFTHWWAVSPWEVGWFHPALGSEKSRCLSIPKKISRVQPALS